MKHPDMNKLFYFSLICCFILSSCGSTKKRIVVSSRNKKYTTTRVNNNSNRNIRKTTVASSRTTKRPSKTKVKNNSKDKKATKIIAYAKTFQGTRYKYGGTTESGMDCSGLVYTSFKKEEVVLPRTSRAMSTQGTKVSLKNIVAGDLLYFKTTKSKNVISHVGLVVSVGNQIRFIHSSSSKGVTISSLDQQYWNNAFAWARRIL